MKTNENKSSQSQMNSNSSSNQGNSNQGSSNTSNSSSMGGMNMSNLTQQLQKYSGPIMNKVNNLSTTQKVVGGAILAAGAGWLAMNPKSRNTVLDNFKKVAANKNGSKNSKKK